MIDRLKAISLPRLRLLLTLLALAVGLGIAAAQPALAPSGDGRGYAAYARTLYLTGQYAATEQGPQADALPGREPLYAALTALAAHVSPSLAKSLTSCPPPEEGCVRGYKVLTYLNGIFLGLATGFTLLALGRLGGGRAAHLVTAGYLILNLHITKDIRYVLSDFLAMTCLALAVWLAVRAWQQKTALAWGLAGVGFSLLALTKASFFPCALLLTGWLGLVGLWKLKSEGVKALLPALSLGLVLVAVNGGWTARNIALFGISSDDRGAIAISTREVFDHMTPAEHLAAWVWWTRGPGNGLAKKWFPPEVWSRHEWYDENGFFKLGQEQNPHRREAELQAAHPELSKAQLQPLLTKTVVGEVLADLPGYIVTMPALFYRGLWCDEFIIVGFPLLILISIRALRRRDGGRLVALLPGWWSLLFYAAISLNIPRYQMTALAALALATGLFAQDWLEKKSQNKTEDATA